MSFTINVQLPNHEEAMTWLAGKDIGMDKLDSIMRDISARAEGALKQKVVEAINAPSISRYPKLPPTGLTLSSITSWLMEQSETRISYAVGSQTRGAQLYWLDRGRGWVYPKSRFALWIKKDRAVDARGKPIFRLFARPSQAHNVMENALIEVIMQSDQIIKKWM
jgi:hypothetical protein